MSNDALVFSAGVTHQTNAHVMDEQVMSVDMFP